MEIEKKRETIWRINQKKKDSMIELISVEESGDINLIKFFLKKLDDSICVEMNKSEFNNFLSVLSAFKDVVIGTEIDAFSSGLGEFEDIDAQTSNEPELVSDGNDIDLTQSEDTSSPEGNLPDKEEFKGEEELNPKEWDPW